MYMFYIHLYTYIHIYVCILLYIHMSTYKFIYMYIYVYICISTRKYIHILHVDFDVWFSVPIEIFMTLISCLSYCLGFWDDHGIDDRSMQFEVEIHERANLEQISLWMYVSIKYEHTQICMCANLCQIYIIYIHVYINVIYTFIYVQICTYV